MAYLKDLATGRMVSRYVNFNKTQEATLTVQTALDGTEYLTRFGAPVYNYEVEVFVNETGQQELMDAFDRLDMMEVSVRIGTFSGRMKSLDKFELQYYGWYKTKVILSPESEVADR